MSAPPAIIMERISAASMSVRTGVAKRRDWQRERIVAGSAAGLLVIRRNRQ